MKIVLVRNIKYDFESVLIVGDDGETHIGDDEYIVMSEVIDVEFPMTEVDINARKAEAIDKEISKAKAGIELLEQAKAELLAIPDMRGEK